MIVYGAAELMLGFTGWQPGVAISPIWAGCFSVGC